MYVKAVHEVYSALATLIGERNDQGTGETLPVSYRQIAEYLELPIDVVRASLVLLQHQHLIGVVRTNAANAYRLNPITEAPALRVIDGDAS